MYVQPCFIRKNTKELRDKLEDFGLKLINSDGTTIDCHNYDGKGNHRNIDEGRAIITYYSDHYGIVYDIDKAANKDRIDCNDNEDLFLALAALRNDTDEHQWFIMDVEVYANIKKGDWFKATDINGKYHVGSKIDPCYCHKASVKELIDFFSKE